MVETGEAAATEDRAMAIPNAYMSDEEIDCQRACSRQIRQIHQRMRQSTWTIKGRSGEQFCAGQQRL